MKYLLGIGFYGSMYKRIPTIQLFVGNRLIDEFEPESIDGYEKYEVTYNKEWWASHGTKTNKNREYKDIITHLPKNFKLYTIEEQVLKEASKLEIKIKNADTNYSNGFMTKSTLINLSNIFLIPTNIFEHYLTRQKKDSEFYNKIKSILPLCVKEEWDNIPYAYYGTTRFKGYPFPFKYFWNGEHIENSLNHYFGGNGTLKLDLIHENNTVMFDYYKTDLLKMMHEGWISDKNMSFGAGSGNPWKDVCSGFPFANEFFVLSHILNPNK
jgi:hypothetical protein